MFKMRIYLILIIIDIYIIIFNFFIHFMKIMSARSFFHFLKVGGNVARSEADYNTATGYSIRFYPRFSRAATAWRIARKSKGDRPGAMAADDT